ncbi:MAG: MFS transporter [Acetobacteraceae bacterium]|nr:MFS transporter [Acetobacteraceae bacterium]
MPDATPVAPAATRAAALPRMPWALLAAACLAMFAASSSGTARAPFLLDMAQDLSASVALVANLMASTSIAWGISSLVVGAWSDRLGRRPFLVGGPIGLAACMLGVALSEGFWGVALWATVAGAFCGGFTGVVMAEASARTVDRQRGRALGWVMAGQSLTLLVGVPMAAFLGAYIGWRGVNVAIGGLALAAALALLVTTLRPAPGEERHGGGKRRGGGGGGTLSALTGPVIRLLAMGVAERICYGLAAVYFATFLQTTYGLSLAGVALPLAVFALGNIAGTVIGGQAADRLPDRLRTFAAAMLASAGAALALFLWTPGLKGTVALGFLYVFLNAIARPSLMAALANVPDEVRGTVLGLNVSSASIGWLGAAALGGWVMAAFGFGAFGPLAAGMAVAGAGLALTAPRR